MHDDEPEPAAPTIEPTETFNSAFLAAEMKRMGANPETADLFAQVLGEQFNRIEALETGLAALQGKFGY